MQNATESHLIVSTRSNLEPERIQQDSIQIWSWIHQPGFSASTKTLYVRIVREFFGFHFNVGVKEITTPHITLFLNRKSEHSQATKNLEKYALSSLFQYLENTGYIYLNPVKVIKKEKVPDRFQIKILAFEDIQRMLDQEPSERNRLFIEIAYSTGLRVSELLQLQLKSFRVATVGDSGGAYLTIVGKGSKTRTVLILEDLWLKVQSFTGQQGHLLSDYIFSADGERAVPLTRMRAFQIIKAAAVRAKLNPLPSPHWFRHTSATHAIENGAPIHVVQATLGHASMATTGKYLNSRPKQSNSSFLKVLK